LPNKMILDNTCGYCRISYRIEWQNFDSGYDVENDEYEEREPLICPFCASEIGDEYIEDDEI